MDKTIVRFTYTNHRGETAERTVRPIRVYFGSTPYHPEPGWLLEAFCLDRRETRDFSMRPEHMKGGWANVGSGVVSDPDAGGRS